MTDPNAETLRAYEEGWERYLMGTPAVPLDVHGPWLPQALGMRPPHSRVLEIGSGPGHDAAQMEELGIDVERTDACEAFVGNLLDQGDKARVLNVLTDDDLGGPYGMIYAFAVFQHFTSRQVVTVLRKCHDALMPGGVLAFSMRRGLTPEWSERKGMARRLFWYWQPGRLWDKIEFAGFTIRAMYQDTAIRQDSDQAQKTWLLVTAVREH